jgi:2-dehydro-3-deoxygluconokinase
MPEVISFGEIMMRLSPPGKKKLDQTDQLEILFSGAEANVSAALAAWGVHAAHVTRFPDNPLGKAAIGAWKRLNVDMSFTSYSEDRLGLYFVENGAMNRSTNITYDRLPSSFSTIGKGSFDWDAILDGAKWFHWTGITPALSQGAADCLLEALQVAQKKNIKVSADINYRSNLWRYGKDPGEIMAPLVALSQVIVAAETDTAKIFGINADVNDQGFMEITNKMKEKFPSIECMISSRRESPSSSRNNLSGIASDGHAVLRTRTYEMDNIVERIGSGDAFIAGYIYGCLQQWEQYKTLEYATASAVMKHSVEGDVNRASSQEIIDLMNGDMGGWIKR